KCRPTCRVATSRPSPTSTSDGPLAGVDLGLAGVRPQARRVSRARRGGRASAHASTPGPLEIHVLVEPASHGRASVHQGDLGTGPGLVHDDLHAVTNARGGA